MVLEGPGASIGLLIGAVLGVEALELARAAEGGRLSRGLVAAQAGAATLLDAAALGAEAETRFGARPRASLPPKP
jgi:hypothetical protein